MTKKSINNSGAKSKSNLKKEKKLSTGFLIKCCFGYMSIFMLLLFLKRPEETSSWVKRGLELCATRLIPSLFPFMVVSSLLTSSGIGERIGKILHKPFRFLFGIGAYGSSALVIGWICGFPIGAKSASELYREGKISHKELERIICISGIPSAAFLINTVGAVLLNNTRLGMALYLICLLASISVGVIKKRIDKTPYVSKNEISANQVGESVSFAAEKFTRAVAESATGMLCVCGFVIFFSAFVGALESITSAVSSNRLITDLGFGFFEMTSGLSRIADSQISLGLKFAACAAVSAWSGLSVHLQVISICGDCELRLSRYFAFNIAKAAIATIAALLTIPLLSYL